MALKLLWAAHVFLLKLLRLLCSSEKKVQQQLQRDATKMFTKLLAWLYSILCNHTKISQHTANGKAKKKKQMEFHVL